MTSGFMAGAVATLLVSTSAFTQDEPVYVAPADPRASTAGAAPASSGLDPLGQPVSGGACLAFEDAIQLSADIDPQVAAARAERLRANAQFTEAVSLFRPQINAFGRAGEGDSTLADNQIQTQFGIQISQRIIDFGDARFAREAARQSVTAREYEIRNAQLLSGLQTGLAYLNLLEAAAQLDATAERQAYFEDQLSAVESALAQGGATISDRAEVAAELAEAEALALELEFELQRFATQVAVNTGAQPNVCGPDPAESALDRLTRDFINVEDVVALALDMNPQLQALESETRGLEASLQRERRNRFPAIALAATGSYVYDDNTEDFEFLDQYGVDVTVPLYSGAALGAAVDRSEADLQSAESSLADAQRNVREQVSVSLRRVRSLQAQTIRRENVEARKREQFEAAELEYQRGLRTLPDLVEIRIEFEEAALSAIRTRFNLLREELQLLSLVGQLPVDLEPIQGPEARRIWGFEPDPFN